MPNKSPTVRPRQIVWSIQTVLLLQVWSLADVVHVVLRRFTALRSLSTIKSEQQSSEQIIYTILLRSGHSRNGCSRNRLQTHLSSHYSCVLLPVYIYSWVQRLRYWYSNSARPSALVLSARWGPYVPFRNNVRGVYGTRTVIKMQSHFVELAAVLARNSNWN